ncbi:MAG TPA: hypothetical protein VMN38_09040 [Sphingomicrobium sp.]|nr:hypothetical protein [Sphingomicrobium sp.]
MARPIPSGKKFVNLASHPASSGPRVSRIRRDPPPPVVKEKFVDPVERDQWVVIVGILAFALAIFVIILAFGSYSTWSPRDYKVEVKIGE